MIQLLKNKTFLAASFILVLAFIAYSTQNKWLEQHPKEYDLDMVNSASTLLKNEIQSGATVTVVNFWASWCPPCIQETPSMLQFAKKHSDKIQFYMVSEDSSAKEIRDFLKAFTDVYNVNLKVIWDADRKIGRSFKVYKMPETFVFDSTGKLVRQFSGSMDWSNPEVEKFFSELRF